MGNEIVSKGWTKLDSAITESTLWMKDHATLRVWIALLAKCDAGGYARVAAPAMAHICMMKLDEFETIMDDLCAPDKYSRCSDNEGRRVQRVEGGYVVLSYERYRQMKTRALTPAERKQRQREREAAGALVSGSHASHESHYVTPEEKQKQRRSRSRGEADTTKDSCSEPSSKPVLVFETVGKVKSWELTPQKVTEWRGDFPHLDIEAECRKARAWLVANPTKRKTAKGMPRFLVGWLGRSQDSGKGSRSPEKSTTDWSKVEGARA